MGRARLLADGQPVHLSLSKALDLVAYLLVHPASTLETILADVFGDADAKAAKNYFHQIKYQLGQDARGLAIRYDRLTRTYAVDAGLAPVEFDYEEIVRLLSAPTDTGFTQALELYAGPFLRHADAEWVEGVRSDLEWLLVRSGLKVIQNLYEQGQYEQCRRLTTRLLKVEPLDVALNELLVRATAEIEGALAARSTLGRVMREFEVQIGERPETLRRLGTEFDARLN